MVTRSWRGLAGCLATACLLAACADFPTLKEIPVAAVQSPKSPLTDADVKDAILRAAASTGWTVKEDAPGKLVATKTVEDQMAMVAIGYNISAYSIRYRDSRNLKYRVKPIKDMMGGVHDPLHAQVDKTYNEWVDALDQAIQRELASLS